MLELSWKFKLRAGQIVPDQDSDLFRRRYLEAHPAEIPALLARRTRVSVDEQLTWYRARPTIGQL